MALTLPQFPNTSDEPFTAKSPKDPKYNCIGWACGGKTKLWPNTYSYHWPPEIPNVVHIDSFVQLFQSKGYEICADGEYEKGYLKVAIYCLNGVPQHAARQLDNGEWTSKLGLQQDVNHSIYSMDGGQYGSVTHYLRRTIPQAPKKK